MPNNKFSQISLLDIYEDVNTSFTEKKSELVSLLEKHIDFSSLISYEFHHAFYSNIGRKHKYHLESFIKALIKGFTLFSPHLSLAWHLPHQGEDFKNIANGFTKNAMKLHFTKSFTKFFSKNFQGLGWNPKVFQFAKFIVMLLRFVFSNFAE